MNNRSSSVTLQLALILIPDVKEELIQERIAELHKEEAAKVVENKGDFSASFLNRGRPKLQKLEDKIREDTYKEPQTYSKYFLLNLWDFAFGKYDNLMKKHQNASMAGVVTGIKNKVIQFQDVEGGRMFYDTTTAQCYKPYVVTDAVSGEEVEETMPMRQVCIEHPYIVKEPPETDNESDQQDPEQLDLSKPLDELF